jgi:hypothetical protein
MAISLRSFHFIILAVPEKVTDHDEEEWNAHQLPPRLWDRVYAADRLHEGRVHNLRLSHPEGTEEVDPFTRDGLLESTTLIWAEKTFLRIRQ